jgi:hypothetical protein
MKTEQTIAPNNQLTHETDIPFAASHVALDQGEGSTMTANEFHQKPESLNIHINNEFMRPAEVILSTMYQRYNLQQWPRKENKQ